MAENPGKVVTKFQFCSLLHKAWFRSIQPETIKSGFRKAGIYPFDATAIKPLASSQTTENDQCMPSTSGNDQPTSSTSRNDQATSSTSGNNQPTSSTSGNNQITVSEKEHSCSSGTTFEDSTISFTEDQITLFERRYNNGYNLYHDKVYVAWLQQEHPECLPKDPDICPVMENTNTDNISQSDNSLAEVQSLSENSCQSSVQESSGTSPMDVQAPTKSLSVSLSQTRSLLSELSEFLDKPKAPAKAKGKTTKARVLTSAESLSLLIEKEKKKKEEEEAKEKRKEERERKRKESRRS